MGLVRWLVVEAKVLTDINGASEIQKQVYSTTVLMTLRGA